MILWTCHEKPAYETLINKGVLRGDWRRSDMKEFIPAYKWMANEMVKRGIMKKPHSMVWAWHTYNEEHRRPDFRTTTYRWWIKTAKNPPVYRITIDAPKNKILLSDFDSWHTVLQSYMNRPLRKEYLCVNKKEYDKIYPNDAFIAHASDKEIEQSWQRIFNVNRKRGYYFYPGPLSIQACLPYIKLEWVKKIEEFSK